MGSILDPKPPTRAELTATYVSMTQAQVSIDTDGVPYFSPGAAFVDAVPVLTDTDGEPYFV